MWNGMFDPTLKKRVGSVIFVPFDQMTNADWDWLDYDNLRNTARNRLAKVILEGLTGFLDVRLVHGEPEESDADDPEDEGEDPDDRWGVLVPGGRAKRRYLYGATGEDEEEFEEDNHDFFRNEAEETDESEEAEEIDNARALVEIQDREEVQNYLRMMLPEDESRARNAIDNSNSLKDIHFSLLVVIVLAIIAKARNITFDRAVTLMMDYLSAPSTIAAGRGLTATQQSGRLGL